VCEARNVPPMVQHSDDHGDRATIDGTHARPSVRNEGAREILSMSAAQEEEQTKEMVAAATGERRREERKSERRALFLSLVSELGYFADRSRPSVRLCVYAHASVCGICRVSFGTLADAPREC